MPDLFSRVSERKLQCISILRSAVEAFLKEDAVPSLDTRAALRVQQITRRLCGKHSVEYVDPSFGPFSGVREANSAC